VARMAAAAIEKTEGLSGFFEWHALAMILSERKRNGASEARRFGAYAHGQLLLLNSDSSVSDNWTTANSMAMPSSK
jgi:hypothetical protein